MKKFYYRLEIVYSYNNYEQIYNTLYLSGLKSILEENGSLYVYFKVSETKKIDSITHKLLNLPSFSQLDLFLNKIEGVNWNQKWMNSINPVYIEKKLVITPTWKAKTIKHKKGLAIIRIDPKMSFGTGQSETTQMILKLMCQYLDKTDTRMLDYGCGSGILAIAGIKLGINSAVAIDIDEDAIENAKENIKKNRVDKKIKLYRCDITNIREKNSDIICANINFAVITKNINIIKSTLKKNGKLFITGILLEEQEQFIEVLKKNKFEVIETYESPEWIALYCIKN